MAHSVCRRRGKVCQKWLRRASAAPSSGNVRRERRRSPGGQTRLCCRRLSPFGALGVVFGDIGTSPLYTIQIVFNPDDPHPGDVTTESIYGIVSLIFWAVTIVVTVTYVLLVTRADNDGERGSWRRSP
jgi:hypothetical protein